MVRSKYSLKHALAGYTSIVAVMALTGGAATAQNSQNSQSEEETVIEEVVVTGYRSSLAENLRLKRDANVIQDSIVAQDIGQFADVNLAEALQRIPGIALQRENRTDEGEQIVVRGLPADFTQVLLNGVGVRLVEGNDTSRGFNFQVFATELFSRIDVYKSPQASMEEGGIAATVNLQTPRPLDYDEGASFAYSARGQYRENSDNLGPRLSALYTQNWGEFGIVVSAAYQDYTIFGNGYQPDDYTCAACLPSDQFFDFDAPGVNLNGFTEEQVNAAFFPRLPRTNYRRTEQERIGLTTTLQYKVDDKINIILDGMYAKLNDPNGQFFLFDGQFRSAATAGSAAGPIVPLDVFITEENDLYGRFGNVVPRTETTYTSGETEFIYGSLRGEFKITSNLDMNIQIAGSDNTTNSAFDFGLVAVTSGSDATGPIGRELLFDPTTDPFFPTIQYDFDILSPSNYINSLRILTVSDVTTQDDVYHGRLDFDWRPDAIQADFIDDFSLKYGISFDHYGKRTGRVNGIGEVRDNVAAAIAGGLTTADYLIPFPFTSDVNGRVNDNFLTEFPVISRDVLELFGTQQALNNGALIPPTFFDVDEDIFAAFVQMNMNGEVGGLSYRFNGGVRYVRTSTDVVNLTNAFGGGFEEVSLDNSYDDFLPSANLAVDLSDDLLFRASFAKTLTRPPLASLGARVTSQNFFAFPEPLSASGGNPTLDATRGTQYDIGLEWYFAPESVFSVGLFSKRLTGLTANGVTEILFSDFGPDFAQEFPNVPGDAPVLLSGPVNLDRLTVRGIELAFQMPFDAIDKMPEFLKGFGVTANVTFIDENGGSPFRFQDTPGVAPETIRVPALRIPDTALNLGAYYENGPFAIRMNYNWVDEFTLDLNNRDVDEAARIERGIGTNLFEVQAPRGVLDGSISYEINEHVEIAFQALNITNSRVNTNFQSAVGNPAFGDGQFRTDQSQVFGRIFFFGIQGKF